MSDSIRTARGIGGATVADSLHRSGIGSCAVLAGTLFMGGKLFVRPFRQHDRVRDPGRGRRTRRRANAGGERGGTPR